jgi:hypothetical protein
VTFFMFLMFWVPHPGQPVPVFEDILAAFSDGGLLMQLAILIAVTGIAGFAFLNIKMLIWNLARLGRIQENRRLRQADELERETQFLAMPLAAGDDGECRFHTGTGLRARPLERGRIPVPVAMVAFRADAYLAFRRIGAFLGRVLSDGGVFDVTANNSFAQLLPAFALSMTAVGMAAPAAMSTVPATVGVSLVLSITLGAIAGLYALAAAIIALGSMLQHGTAKESAPTLMIVVPILTILGIMTMRQEHGLHTTFDAHGGMADNLILTTTSWLSRVFSWPSECWCSSARSMPMRSCAATGIRPVPIALVCPGVALSVMLHFWINRDWSVRKSSRSSEWPTGPSRPWRLLPRSP